jgi:hypothetical protein
MACLIAVARTDMALDQSTTEAKEMVEERRLSVKLLASGILKNIAPIPAPSTASAIDIDRQVILPIIVPTISSVSLLEASNSVSKLVSSDNEPNPEKPSLRYVPTPDHKSPKEIALERIEARLRNIQLSLEILTGMCATLPDHETLGEDDVPLGEDDVPLGEDDENDEDIDGEDEDGGDVEMNEVSLESELAPDASQTDSTAPETLPPILTPLLSLIQPTSLSFPPLQFGSATANTLLQHPPTTSVLGAIHINALECLNNACLALALNGEGRGVSSQRTDCEDGRKVWDTIWKALGEVGLEGGKGQERRREMWEAAVGVMWGVSRIWKGSIVRTCLIYFRG